MITVVIDTSVLSGFARAGKLDILGNILRDVRVTTTSEVLDEIRAGVPIHPVLEHVLRLSWIEEVHVSGLAAMGIFAEYSKRLGSGTNGDVGEATVLTWAEVHGVIPVVDEKAGRQAAKERGIVCRGSLWLIARGIGNGTMSMTQAAQLIDDLQTAGMFLPCSGANFPAWANEHGLFGPVIVEGKKNQRGPGLPSAKS